VEIRTADGRFETRSANPYLPWGSTAPPPPGAGWATAGVTVTEQSALQLAAVFGSVDLISSSIATLPLRQYRATGRDTAIEIDPAPVIAQPWSEVTQRDFITQGTVSMLLRGNLYGDILGRDEKLYPDQVKLVHPDHVTVRRNRDSGLIEVRYWNELVPPDNVTRAMALQVPEGLVGLNPIEYMRNVLGLARAQDLASGAFFANSARPDGVFLVPGDLPDNELKAMKDSWNSSHQGINGMFTPGFLTGGTTFQPITMNLADAQFLEQMQLSESVISGRIYRVPPHMLGMVDKDTSWGAGIEQQELGYVRNTLLIWLSRWEDLLSSWLPPRQFVMFDLSQRLRGDTLQRWSAWQIARVIGAMSSAEIRKVEGLPPVTDPAQSTVLEAFDQPFNSSPIKPTATGGAGGDKSD
jgi:HK97 family phage portal protein